MLTQKKLRAMAEGKAPLSTGFKNKRYGDIENVFVPKTRKEIVPGLGEICDLPELMEIGTRLGVKLSVNFIEELKQQELFNNGIDYLFSRVGGKTVYSKDRCTRKLEVIKQAMQEIPNWDTNILRRYLLKAKLLI